MKATLVILTASLFVPLAHAKYSGGTGEPNDPYQIATAEDLMLLGETPEDYDKHFILTADIDLDRNLPGRKVFDRAVIAPDTNDVESGHQGTAFTGVFDGSGHTISHLTIRGWEYVGLFGRLTSGAEVRDLGVVVVNIVGSSSDVGGLVGCNEGTVARCYSTGSVRGKDFVGGLAGENSGGNLTNCHSDAMVMGDSWIGGLVGYDSGGNIINSYSIGTVGPNAPDNSKGRELYVLTKSGIMEVSLAGEQRTIVDGRYDSYSLEVKDDILYVTDKRRGGNIIAYDLEGQYLRTIRTPPQAVDYLTFVALPNDKFALLDNINDKVFFCDDQGNLIATTRIRSVPDNHLQNIGGIVVGNRLILSEDGDRRVLQIDLGTYQMSIFKDLSALPNWLGAIAYANGTYYICSPDIVYSFSNSGRAVQVARVPDYNLTGIVVIDDRAYVTVNFGGKVYKIELSSGANTILASGLNYPEDIAVSSADTYLGAPNGESYLGGLVGYNHSGDVTGCFWDTQTSGQTRSAGGTGKTTTEMKSASTFLNAGWDFVNETTNGTEDIWRIDEGKDYPRLWWESMSTPPPPPPAEGNVIELTEATFDQIVLGSDIPVLVDFWAPWCPPCLVMAPVIEEIAKEYAGRAKVCKLDTDTSPNINRRYNIQYIPTFILFNEGQIHKRWVGVTPKKDLTDAIDELLTTNAKRIIIGVN